ncbi:MAG: bifunctional 23S rRNA (guanine(2069)-N(7))-methyltransferase RlmK/23S rRNA (guanine(2445)-N(2))-methyltransferase RlmL [Gammaproteobacteria bacterium]|nr:MAG: bifunctional 23S rRNA (guanine(2069)-N(7))-methyltransferase RlmK/23S rRNA (guanine(2445)-N(2))-methyltransferase RlmL [Gammaproteobacteria bacterium]
MPLKLFITGHKGFETLLFHEIRQILREREAKITKRYGGVEVLGGIECAYRLCLYSRLSNRVFCELRQFKVEDEEQLYEAIHELDWSEHLAPDNSFAVSATLSRSNMDHTHYASLKVKDAIVDQFRERFNSRPSIEKQHPDIHIHLNIHRNQASLSLDLSGESLHRRGYRSEHSGAPLKEHLAASIIAYAGWTREVAKTHRFIDPMCGSGTFVIEAAMIAANIAPGLDRTYFGFSKWLQHDVSLWQACRQEAEKQIDHSLKPSIFGSDYDNRAIEISRANAARAGVEDLIQFTHQDISDLQIEEDHRPAVIICNPPYGERLQSEQGLASLYSDMGNSLRQFAPANVHIISANPDLLHRLRLKRVSKKAVKNGPIDCVLAGFEIELETAAGKPVEDTRPSKSGPGKIRDTERESVTPLINRLQKNSKHLRRWAKRNGVSCYRIYDADLPEFSFALDVYQSEISPSLYWYHMQEYQAPKTIDEDKAESRIELARQAVKQVFEIDDSLLYCKTRRRQRGRQQYQKQDNQGELFQIREGQASLLVNLSDYLDSGLFLDNRIIRQRVFESAREKSVLNLFCYTGSMGVQAALSGANLVINIDMSATYLNWARENHLINGLEDETRYQFLRADVLELLEKPKTYGIDRCFDLIFLDPPSFSNSSKMQQTLDLVRDHERLIEQSMRLLESDGLLLFSTNKKGFKLSDSLPSRYTIKDITRDTIPEDFKRRPGIHRCWEIRHSEKP